ncbi:hypothetical protein [Sphingomonas sp.]|uniref:hypothetical protein n=1 Tax=Sphingomonas sp. TaxID=28214 RepID=UPI003BA8673F
MAMAANITIRRGLLGITAMIPLAGIEAALAAPMPGAAIEAAIRAVDTEALQLRAADAPQAAWNAWEDRMDAAYAAVAALPNTAANARLRAKAILSICGGDLDDVNDGSATIDRLVRDLIVALAGDA